jgi:ATP-binding cassette subfamily E protein 1
MFDEPSSYLDVKQRLNAARAIRGLLAADNYVIVVEHDLSILDYLSDYICVLYGAPGAYGVVTFPFSVREGINIFLAGYVPTERMRFRDEELTFKVSENENDQMMAKLDAAEGNDKLKAALKRQNYSYPNMSKTLGPFKLTV